jgi:DNA-binding NarL/FixJ family response regulator
LQTLELNLMTCFALVVDDSRLARRNAVNILGRLRPDWTCAEASNAEQALAAAQDREISVALIDFNMPGDDGITLAQAIRALHPRAAIAIVSANIQDSVVARAVALDVAFVPKPLTEAAILPFLAGTTPAAD